MDGDQMSEEDRHALLNQLRLDLLLRRLGTTVLRRKFKEIYARLNDGREWRDSPETGLEFCRSKWGNGAFANAKGRQQEMMKGGNIQTWDLNCLQSVITQMLMTALKEMKQDKNSGGWENSQRKPVNWDQSWWGQMSKIRQLANIRHSVAHMPSETLTQGEFDEKWGDAVNSLKGLGAKTKEINEIRQMSQAALSIPAPLPKGEGDCRMSRQNDPGQTQVIGRSKVKIREENKPVEELSTKVETLQLGSKTEVKGQLNDENVNSAVFNEKNEIRANSLMRRGDLAGRSREWDKALEFYTRALDIPDISDDLRSNILVNRSWVHLQMLQMPETPFNLKINVPESAESKSVDEKYPKIMTDEVKQFHLTSGIADAELALQLSPDENSPALYRLAQFHQLKGDWKTALTYFDRSLDQSNLYDLQLEMDRNVCQLELLNQAEVEEFNWILGKKNQTMAGLAVRRNLQRWREFMDSSNNCAHNSVVKAHFLVQGLCWEKQGQHQNVPEVTQQKFEEAVKLYEGAANKGLPSGIYNLGLLLQEGNGVQADFSGAVQLFKTAAQFPIKDDEDKDKIPVWMKGGNFEDPNWETEGILEAQYRLGLCYEFGLGVGKDETKALHWFEKASESNYARASRRLGDIYSQGLLGVSKDENMAIFCWENAAVHGDMVAMTLASTKRLESHAGFGDPFRYTIYNFSETIRFASRNGTPAMLATILDRKAPFESALSNALQKVSQAQSNSIQKEPADNEEREPEEVSWNLPAFIEHTQHTIHLLELAQNSDFLQKLNTIPNWKRQFIFTDRLIEASNCCIKALAALEELNKMYRDVLLEATRGQGGVDTEYTPDLRQIPGINYTILVRECQLRTVILSSFARSIDLVGAAYFRDQPTHALIQSLLYKTLNGVEQGYNEEEYNNYFSAAHIFCYTLLLKKECWEEKLDLAETEEGPQSPFRTISAAVVQGCLGKFEVAAGNVEKSLRKFSDPRHPHNVSKCDLLFVQAVCCKSAGLTRGVNSVIRKKVKEAMTLFQKFLSVCPKDEPRRAEAHYQLALCTLYLEKMKVKGQVKFSAKDILDKILPHFVQGEAAEQEFPWKDFPLPHKSPVKLLLQRKIKELQAWVKKVPGQQHLTLDLDSESLSYGTLVDHFYKFPSSSFPLKLRAKRRVQVVTKFRNFYKEVRDRDVGPLTSPYEVAKLLPLIGTSFSDPSVMTPTKFVGCYEIVEPVFHFRPNGSSSSSSTDDPDKDTVMLFTVVQDESGAVYNIQIILMYPGNEDASKDGQFGGFRRGARIVVHEPLLRLDADGGTTLVVRYADAHVFVIPSKSESKQQQQSHDEAEEESAVTRKCGFCGKIGGTLHSCSKCKMVYYCNKECQKGDWISLRHNWICPSLQKQ